MADDEQPPRHGGRDRAELDRTREFPVFRDRDRAGEQPDEERRPVAADRAATADDGTAVPPRPGVPEDGTIALPHRPDGPHAGPPPPPPPLPHRPGPGDETTALPQPDQSGSETAVLRSDDDRTTVLPAGGAGAAGPPAGARGASPPPLEHTAVLPTVPAWSGRAEVRPAAVPPRGGTAPADWPEPPRGIRRWWLPAMLAAAALVLAGLVGFGIWLALREGGNSGPAVPVTSATGDADRSGPASPDTQTTSGQDQTQDAPAEVVVPRLMGVEADQARAILDDVGLDYRLTNRTTDDFPPGTVIEVDPPEGAVVAKDSRVTLVIAVAPATSAASSPTVSPSATTSGGANPP